VNLVVRWISVGAFMVTLLAGSRCEVQGTTAVSGKAHASEDEKVAVRFYGIIKPAILIGNGLESFGNANYVAVTAAANPLFLNDTDEVASSYQIQQTRVGVIVGQGSPVKGQVEVDFVDFTRSSPTQSTVIRVRQAFVEWTPSAGHKLTLGQLWDVFSPLNSHTFDLVGGMFQAGNSGFMRHQLIYTGTLGSFEGALALGLITQNLTSTLGNVEYNRMPTVAARASYRPSKTTWAGVALIATRLAFDAARPTEKARLSAGANAFADLADGMWNLRAEAYAGQNLNNLGLLVLGQGTATTDVREVGGWASLKATLTQQHAVHVVAGGAFVLTPSNLSIGYVPATDTTPATRLGAIVPGIERNLGLRVGYAYTPTKGLSIVAEPFAFLTRHKLDPSAAADRDRFGWGLQLGSLYSF